MKRLANSNLSGTDDKKARFDAGLDLDLHKDWTDVQVGNILDEVSAPSSVQTWIDDWCKNLTELLSSIDCSSGAQNSIRGNDACKKLAGTLPKDYKFPGCSVVSAKAIGALANNYMVFPKAVGTLLLTVNFNNKPKMDEMVQHVSMFLCLVANKLTGKKGSRLVTGSPSPSYLTWSKFPALTISPSGKFAKQFSVNIEVTVISKQSFAEEWNDKTIGKHPLLFNTRVFDSSLTDELDRLMAAEQNYREGQQVFEIWLRQIQCDLPKYLVPVIFLHCHLTNQIHATMKPWQLVRRIWTYLSEQYTTSTTMQLILGVQKPVPITNWSSASPFLNRDGTTCLFPELPLEQWRGLCSWATSALPASLKESLLVSHKSSALYDRIFLCEGGNFSTRDLITSLKRGLDDRILRILCVRPISADKGEADDPLIKRVVLGLTLDPATYKQPATQGPESDNPDVSQFRQFWGDLSQLRRFQDGTVREMVIWGDKKEEVVGEIVRAVVARHVPAVQQVNEQGSWADRLLVGDGGDKARQLLNELTPVLYGLEGLPLAVSGVAAFSEEARLSRVGSDNKKWAGGSGNAKNGVQPQDKNNKRSKKEKKGKENCGENDSEEKDNQADSMKKIINLLGEEVPEYVQPLDVMLQAEHSGRWPKDEEAIRRLRVAWLIEVGKALCKKVSGLKYHMVGESLVVVPTSRDMVIRFCVGERSGKLAGRSGYMCQLSSWLGGLARSNGSAWSGGIRLVKRWLSVHKLMTGSLDGMAPEIIMASIFSSPGTHGYPPSSPVTAFYRWLEVVCTHDWNETPLFVGCQEVAEVDRASLPPLPIISPHEPSPSYWTKDGPIWPELQRLIIFASNSLQLAEQAGNKEIEQVNRIFTPTLDSYECLIHLDPNMVPNRNLSMERILGRREAKTNRGLKTNDSAPAIPVVDFHPPLIYLQELRNCYSHLAYFYYDQYGGSVIAVKFRQDINKSRTKVTELAAKMTRGVECEVNWGAVIEDWKILGTGLVKDVECRNTEIFV